MICKYFISVYLLLSVSKILTKLCETYELWIKSIICVPIDSHTYCMRKFMRTVISV